MSLEDFDNHVGDNPWHSEFGETDLRQFAREIRGASQAFEQLADESGQPYFDVSRVPWSSILDGVVGLLEDQRGPAQPSSGGRSAARREDRRQIAQGWSTSRAVQRLFEHHVDATQPTPKKALHAWLGGYRPFKSHELEGACLVKLARKSGPYVCRLEPDGSLVEQQMFRPDGSWDGRWRVEEGVLTITIGDYKLSAVASRTGIHPGLEVHKGHSATTAFKVIIARA